MSATMNEDIKQYPIYYVNKDGSFTKIEHIKSTADYNHYTHNLHHYIARKHYEKNKSWYEERGIKQKLFLVPISITNKYIIKPYILYLMMILRAGIRSHAGNLFLIKDTVNIKEYKNGLLY